jgi:hypothetical protein
MKLSVCNSKIRILLVLLLCYSSAHANDNPNIVIYPPYDPVGVIYEFFANNPSPLYFEGTRFFYLGSEFGLVFKNGDFEDRFTNLIFILPFNGKEGIVIEVDDKDVLDAFLFDYDPIGYESSSSIIDKFELKNLSDMRSRLMHRYDVLRQLERIRFLLNDLAGINSHLLLYGIEIKMGT